MFFLSEKLGRPFGGTDPGSLEVSVASPAPAALLVEDASGELPVAPAVEVGEPEGTTGAPAAAVPEALASGEALPDAALGSMEVAEGDAEALAVAAALVVAGAGDVAAGPAVRLR